MSTGITSSAPWNSDYCEQLCLISAILSRALVWSCTHRHLLTFCNNTHAQSIHILTEGRKPRNHSTCIHVLHQCAGTSVIRWRRVFPPPSRPALGSTMGTGSFPGVKRSGRGFDHQPPSSAEVKEVAELYLYSPSEPSWPGLGWTVLFPLPLLVLSA
jgi:hypothetical protein